MRKRYKVLIILAVLFIGIPTLLWIAWSLTTPRPVSVFIMDKTSFSDKRITSRSVNWVLTHRKFVKPDGELYYPRADYYGFFPREEGRYYVRDLARLSSDQLDQMVQKYDMAYYADCYGVFSDSWPGDHEGDIPASLIYGGLDESDLLFMERMLKEKKPVIAEYVLFAPPTSLSLRHKAEDLLGIRWEGWTGRFFVDFRKDGDVLPAWVPALYQIQTGRQWNYTERGVVMVHEDGRIAVLEYPRHLQSPTPVLVAEDHFIKAYGVEPRVDYPGWVDVSFPRSAANKVGAWFELQTTTEGNAILRAAGIPSRFPAVIWQKEPYHQYYFGGDFSFSQVPRRFVRMKGAKYVELFLADLTDPTDKSAFFFGFYLPMMTQILKEVQETHQSPD